MSNTTAPAPAAAPSTQRPDAILETSEGNIAIAFFGDDAPKTVENFKKLARDGFYNGTAFHRIIKGFMIQGGCPNTKADAVGTPGTGGPGHTIKAEFNNRRHVRGVVSMARANDPDSAGSQFFICHGDATFLDRNYTAFAEVVDGDDVLEKIATTPVKPTYGGENSSPVRRIELRRVTIIE